MTEEKKSETITIKKDSLWKYSTFILAAIVIIGVFVFFSEGNGSPVTGNVVADNPGQQLPSQNAQALEVGNSPSIGDENAPVTIYEFSDFSCPFCGASAGLNQEFIDSLKQRDPSWEAAVPNIMKDYVETGKVRFVYKYFPGHGTGQAAQIVGLCLNEQNPDFFWEYHDLVFANQAVTDDYNAMKNLAKQVGADSAALDECINSKKYESSLQEDTNLGRSVGVSGTPSFFVNGRQVKGAQGYSAFKTIIDAELSAA